MTALAGYGVVLEPLVAAHVDELAAGMDDDCWRWTPMAPGPLPRTIDEHRAWLQRWYANAEAAQRSGGEQVFCARRVADGAVVGSTRYLAIAPADRRREIGFTFYRADARATRVNPACKRLLLGHAFEDLGCVRVELKCDARNTRSRAAILKLGAKEEGTFRKHKILGDGYIRDSIYFSILDTEWPDVRDALEARLRSKA